MKHILLILFTALSFSAIGQTVPMTNNVPWYEYSKKLSVGKFMLKSSGEYDTSFTIPSNTASITLDTIAADKTVTFTDGSAYDRGVTMYVQNANNSAFVWNVAGNVKEADGTVISNLPRGLHIFYWNSNAWIRLSTSGGSSPTVDTLTFSSPLVQLDKNVYIDYSNFPNDTISFPIHGDSLYYATYYGARNGDPAYHDSIAILKIVTGGSSYAGGGLRKDVDTVKLNNTAALVDQDINLNAASARTITLQNEGNQAYISVDASGAGIVNSDNSAAILALGTNIQEYGHISGNNYAGFTSDANLDLSATSAFNAFPVTRLAATLTANRTLTTIAGTAQNERWTVINSNSGAFAWQIAGASLYEMDGTAITALTNQTTYDFVWNNALTRWQRKSGGTSGSSVTAAGSTGQVQFKASGAAGGLSADAKVRIDSNYQIQIRTKTVIGDTIARLGTVFTDNFARASLGANYTTTGSTTLTFPSSAYMNVSGTYGGVVTNYLSRATYTGLNRWKQVVTAIPTTVGATTYGIGLAQTARTNFGAGIIAQFNMSNAGGLAGYIFIRDNAGNQVAATTSGITFAANDTLDCTFERWDNYFLATFYNRANAQTKTLAYTYATTSVSPAAPRTGQFQLFWYGGVQNVTKWEVTSNEVKGNPVFFGNSISAGYIASTLDKRFLGLMYGSRESYVLSGGAGDRSADGIANGKLTELLSLNPRLLVYMLGVNDAQNAVSTATYSANVDSVVRYCQSNSIPIILVSNSPNNTYATKPYSDTLAAIASRRGITYVNTYDYLRNGTAFATNYNGDGVHPNDSGHYIIARELVRQYPDVLSNYQIIAKDLSNAETTDRVLARDSLGNFKVTKRVSDLFFKGDVLYSTSVLNSPTTTLPYAMSIVQTAANSFIAGYQNLSSTGWSGAVYYNHLGTLSAGIGYSNSGTPGAVNNSMLFQTYYNSGNFKFRAGNRNITNANNADLQIDSGAIIVGAGAGMATTAQRPATPVAGHFRYNNDSTSYEMYDGTRWIEIPKIIRKTVSLDFPSTAAGAVADLTTPLVGAVDGDIVTVGIPNASMTATGSFFAWVSATGIVTVRFIPHTGTEDPTSGSFKISVQK